MDLRQLKYFVAVYEEGGFLKASQRLHISQPSVTTAIQNLEASLDCALFIRGRRHLTVTAAGLQFYPEAKRLLMDSKRLLSRFQGKDQDERREIKIALPTMVCQTVLTDRLADFAASNAGVKLSVQEMGSLSIEKALIKGDIDYGIITQQPSAGHITELGMIDCFNLCAIMNKSHPLAGHEVIAWQDIFSFPMVSMPDEYVITQNIQKIAQLLAASQDIIMQSSSFQLLLRTLVYSSAIGVFIDRVNIAGLPLVRRPLAPASSPMKTQSIPLRLVRSSFDHTRRQNDDILLTSLLS